MSGSPSQAAKGPTASPTKGNAFKIPPNPRGVVRGGRRAFDRRIPKGRLPRWLTATARSSQSGDEFLMICSTRGGHFNLFALIHCRKHQTIPLTRGFRSYRNTGKVAFPSPFLLMCLLSSVGCRSSSASAGCRVCLPPHGGASEPEGQVNKAWAARGGGVRS